MRGQAFEQRTHRQRLGTRVPRVCAEVPEDTHGGTHTRFLNVQKARQFSVPAGHGLNYFAQGSSQLRPEALRRPRFGKAGFSECATINSNACVNINVLRVSVHLIPRSEELCSAQEVNTSP